MGILGYSDKTIRNMLNQGEILGERISGRSKWLIPESELDRFKREGPGKDPANQDLLSTEEIKEHDIGIFRQGDSIMSEAQVKHLFWRLKHTLRYSKTDFSMLFDYQLFFHFRGNYYINKELRNARDKLYGSFEELMLFILYKGGLFRDEIRILRYHPDVHGMEQITECLVREEKLKQLIESAEAIYNKYRDAVKMVLGI
jgi:excisionase family DNA binding protein